MSDDTIAYTDDDIAALHRMLDHKCTPKWWPHKMGETWTCECGHRFVTDIAANMTDPTSAKAIALGLLDPLTLGWRTA
jgi:hypothetical protein